MVEKLNDMIQDRYGKGFSVRQIVGAEDVTTESRLRGSDLYIPIRAKDVFLGYGLVHEAQDLSPETHAHISRLVRMVLEPALYSQHLERTLHNLEVEQSLDFENSNPTIEETAASKTQKVNSIFVFGQQAQRVQKIGLEIHEISQNWSYLPFRDIEGSLLNVKDLASLGDMTLVVDLEIGVSSSKQELLQDCLKSGLQGPLLLFVASQPSYRLLESGKITEGLHQHLKSIEFSVDRLPVEKGTLRDVLEMLYFQS
ncbi:MAG: hypothetical protein ACK5Y2_13040 [Bdellovibrionales bacterium]